MQGVVEITSGRVAGDRHDGVWSFLGIPYAAAPRGPDRWCAPRAPEPWRGVREALATGPVAPQTPPAAGTVLPGDPTRQDEDCLTVNVWTPGLDDARRPVMVWLHGGGFTTGTGGSMLYNGARLARNGDVVVVTLNYRLGALGFLAHPALADPDTGLIGNAGLMDQVAALRWVRQHVADFGGDPSRVTLFGESAGAMSLCALLAVPAAAGLFHRAIAESGPPYCYSLARSEEAAEDLVRRLGLERVSRQALCEVPAEQLVAAQQAMQAAEPRPGELPLPFLPTIDGSFLPDDPAEAVAEGSGASVDLVIGSNRDEMAFFGMSNPRFLRLDHDGLLRWLARSAPEVDAQVMVAHYREVRASRGEPCAPFNLWVAIGTDLVFRWPSIRLADDHAKKGLAGTYTYLFTWSTPAFGGLLGSCHALEIPFVFGCYRDKPVTPFVGGNQPGAAELAAALQGAWVAFARGGEPAHAGIGSWPCWDPVDRPTMVFGDGGRLALRPRDEELALWRSVTTRSELAGLGGKAGPGGLGGLVPEADEVPPDRGEPTRGS